MKRSGRAPAGKQSVTFADPGKGWSSAESTQQAVRQAGANLEAQRAAAPAGGGAAGPAGSNKKAVPRGVDPGWGKHNASQGGKPFPAAAAPTPKGKAPAAPAAGQRGGGAAGAKGRVPFWNEYEQEEELLNRPGNSDQTGRYKDPDFPADATSLCRPPPPQHPPLFLLLLFLLLLRRRLPPCASLPPVLTGRVSSIFSY